MMGRRWMHWHCWTGLLQQAALSCDVAIAFSALKPFNSLILSKSKSSNCRNHSSSLINQSPTSSLLPLSLQYRGGYYNNNNNNNNNVRSITSDVHNKLNVATTTTTTLIPQNEIITTKINSNKMRGGASVASRTVDTKVTITNSSISAPSTNRFEMTLSKRNQVLLVSATITLGAALYFTRHSWLPLLDRNKIQQSTLSALDRLKGPPGTSNVQPLVLYSLGLAVWEALGLSTIPVETAAAMVFGWPAGLASAAGKLGGALGAFGLGRTLLKSTVQQRLNHQPILQLLNSSTRPAWQTAFLFKFSVFPELLKNCGPALVPAIAPWMFASATVVHGWIFTGLWTWVGVDAAARLQAESGSIPTNSALQLALFVAGVIGIGCVPLLTAWWMRDLAKQSQTEKL